MYRDREVTHGDERLTTVLESLGYTTGAGYQIWPNQAAFREELKVYVAEHIEYASLKGIADEIAALAEQRLPWREHVLAAGDNYIRYFLDQEEFYLSLRFFAMREDRAEAITDGLRRAYDDAADEAAVLFERVLARYERQIRPSFTMRQVTAAVGAVLEGYALQARVRPLEVDELISIEGGKHHQFSVAFLAIVDAYTEEIPNS